MRLGREEPKPGEVWKHHTGLQYKVLGLEKIGERPLISRDFGDSQTAYFTHTQDQQKLILIHDDRTPNATQVFLEGTRDELIFVSLPVFMGRIGIHYRFKRISADV
jgi:hypothetical protein